jgi:hypothetical protein
LCYFVENDSVKIGREEISTSAFALSVQCFLLFYHTFVGFQVFDREGDDGKFVSVTVKATDQGEPSLEGVCSFTVEITDVNDNPPLFDRQVKFQFYVCNVYLIHVVTCVRCVC